MTNSPRVVLFRDRLINGSMTMEQYARELTRMDGSSSRGPCLAADRGARLWTTTRRVEAEPQPQSLFAEL